MPRPTAGAETQKEAEGRACFPAEQLRDLGSQHSPWDAPCAYSFEAVARVLVPELQ